MTQLSYNTIVYDQIIRLVSKFLDDHNENRYGNNSKMLEEYQALIDKIQLRISRTNF